MGLKTYYLAELAYWLQQMIILIARIEKPRKDFKELVAHVSRCCRSMTDLPSTWSRCGSSSGATTCM